jgi:uncharacterized protein (TIGR03066 family)
MLRAVLCGVLALPLCGVMSADDKKPGGKIDAKKLIGKWEPKEEAVFTVEFREGGKATLVTATADGKVRESEGTYKLEGNKLTTTVKVGDQERTLKSTISRLTDAELVGTDEKGREKTLVRVKGK